MRNKAEVVIIGGGITGCALAYYLAKKGLKDVVLVERNFLASGATGRGGAGIRQQFHTKPNIRLAQESVRIFEGLTEKLEADIEYKQKGYLILAETEAEAKQQKEGLKRQKELGLNSQYLSPKEAKEIVPMLKTEKILGATFCSTDGYADPFKVVDAYSRKTRELGAEINTFTEVVGIEAEGSAISRVLTNRGEIDTRIAVNAAGASSKEIGSMVGVDLPNQPVRHQAFATESVEHIIDPMVLSLNSGVWCRQTPDGEIIGGIGDPEEPPGYNLESSLKFLKRATDKLTELLPGLGRLNILRQWAGHYDLTPDAHPIVGWTKGVKGFLQANGYSGHGFMIAPKVAELIAELIIDGNASLPIERFKLERFEGEVEEEKFVFG